MKLAAGTLVIVALSFTAAVAGAQEVADESDDPDTTPMLRMTTSLGVIELALDAERAPKTTANFLDYVDEGFYDGTIFHRVIPGFMIQGGGFEPGLEQKPAGEPIKNEADNGLENRAGTIAMARTADPHSATAQFFINTEDNPALDHRSRTPQGWGYAVFGRVTSGMEVVEAIAEVPTRRVGAHADVPVEDVVIERVERLD